MRDVGRGRSALSSANSSFLSTARDSEPQYLAMEKDAKMTVGHWDYERKKKKADATAALDTEEFKLAQFLYALKDMDAGGNKALIQTSVDLKPNAADPNIMDVAIAVHLNGGLASRVSVLDNANEYKLQSLQGIPVADFTRLLSKNEPARKVFDAHREKWVALLKERRLAATSKTASADVIKFAVNKGRDAIPQPEDLKVKALPFQLQSMAW